MAQLQKKDLILVSFFRNNARENLTQISRQTSIPVSTIFDRLRHYEQSLIKKHTTLVDFKKIGFDIHVNLLFKIKREGRESFKEYVLKHFNINSVYRVNNGFDFFVDAIFHDMNEMNAFLDEAESYGIEHKQELFVLEDLKLESFLSDRIHADILYTKL